MNTHWLSCATFASMGAAFFVEGIWPLGLAAWVVAGLQLSLGPEPKALPPSRPIVAGVDEPGWHRNAVLQRWNTRRGR